MNDFTREELIQIAAWATTDIDFNPSDLEIKLFDKIKSMIENYCEHTYVARTAPHAHGAKEVEAIVQCNKCGEFYK